MKTLGDNILPVAVLFLAVIFTARAQTIMVCNENPRPCPQGNGITSFLSGGVLPGPVTLNTQAPATFNILAWGPCCPSVFTPVSWSGAGYDPTIGNFTWSFVIPNTCQPSTLTPMNPGGCYPALVDLYFEIEGTTALNPGVTFHSRGCLHLQGIVTSCMPFNCESFTLVGGPVPFDDNSGNFAFNLDNLIVVLDN